MVKKILQLTKIEIKLRLLFLIIFFWNDSRVTYFRMPNSLRVSTDEEPQRRVTKSQQRWSMGTRKLRTIGKLFATQEVPEEDSKEYVPVEGTDA